MKELLFRGAAGVVCKGAEGVDGGMDDNAGNKTSAAVKDRHEQEAYRDRKAYLAQVAHKAHAAVIEQIYKMSDAEGHARDDDRGAHIILCDGDEQEAPEYHFLQKSDAEHARDAAGRFSRRIVDGGAVPEVPGRKDEERHIVQEPAGGNGRDAETVAPQQAVLSDEGKNNYGLYDTEGGARGVIDAYRLIQRVGQGLHDAVDHDARDRKIQFVFLVQLFHFVSSCAAVTETVNAAQTASPVCTASECPAALFLIFGFHVHARVSYPPARERARRGQSCPPQSRVSP